MNIPYFIIVLLLIVEFYFNSLFSTKFIFPIVLMLIFINLIKRSIPRKFLNCLLLITIFIIIQYFNSNIINIQFVSGLLGIASSLFLYFILDSKRVKNSEIIRYVYILSYIAGIISLLLFSLGKTRFPQELFPSSGFYIRFSLSIPVILLPLIYLQFRNRKNFVLYMIILSIIVVFSNWRAIQVAFLVNLTYIFYIRRIKKGIVYSTLIIAVLAIVFLLNNNNIRLLELFTNPYYTNDITTGRMNLWQKSIITYKKSTISEKIFGQGIGQFAFAINKVPVGATSYTLFNVQYVSLDLKDKNSRIHAHNFFFNTLVEYGLIGIFIYMLFVISIYRNIKKIKNNTIKTALYFSFASLLLSGSFTSIAYFTQPLLILLLIISKKETDVN